MAHDNKRISSLLPYSSTLSCNFANVYTHASLAAAINHRHLCLQIISKKLKWVFAQRKLIPTGLSYPLEGKVNRTETELFRLTFAERIAESKLWTQQIAQQKFLLSESLSLNPKRHFTFWIKFGLSPKFGLSERLIQQVVTQCLMLRPRQKLDNMQLNAW